MIITADTIKFEKQIEEMDRRAEEGELVTIRTRCGQETHVKQGLIDVMREFYGVDVVKEIEGIDMRESFE